MTEPTPPEAVADPSDGDILPGDVPDSAVIASALHQHLRDWDEAETLADAVLARLGEYGRVVARLPRGVILAEEIHSRVVASTPEVSQEWVDAAVEEWHRAGVQEPELLLDDQMRRILAAVLPSIAKQARADGASAERARIVAQLRVNVERFHGMAKDQETVGAGWQCHAKAFAVQEVADAIERGGDE